MKSLIFFIIGFALALAVLFLWNLQYFRQRRKKRKEELQEHPEKKTSATKIIIFSILATYYIAFAVGVWVVVGVSVFTEDDLSICRGRVGSGHKGFLPVISPFDIRWRGNCCRSSVLLLESKGRKPAENQSCIPGVVRHAV